MSAPYIHRIDRALLPGERVLVPVVGDHVVLWPPHTDEHDGQPARHWHIDPRFGDQHALGSKRIESTEPHRWEVRTVERPFQVIVEADEYFGVVHKVGTATPVAMVSGALRRMARTCTHKGKCPHRGFNLAQVEPLGGVVVCPMHGMRFRASDGAALPYRRRTRIDEEFMIANDAKL